MTRLREPSVTLVTMLLALGACSQNPPAFSALRGAQAEASTTPLEPAPSASHSRGTLRGSLRLSQALASYAPRGHVALGWLSPDELQGLKNDKALSMRTIRELMTDRMIAIGEVSFLTLATAIPYTLSVPEKEVVAFALLDTCGNFFGTLFGGCEGNVIGYGSPVHAKAGVTLDVDITLSDRAAARPHSEGCAGERKELLRIEAPRVAGTIANETSRRLCVLLPPSYAARAPRRYPVIYALPGLYGDDTGLFRRHLDRIVDQVEEALQREVIVVTVDTSTRFGSSYLVNSPLDGDFDSFLADLVIPVVDKKYRTLARPKSRALMGQSTGGFNAISFGLRHTELFGAIAAMSPDWLDLRSIVSTDQPGASDKLATPWLHLMRLEDGMKGTGQMVSYAADWSPDSTKERGFAWPVDLATGRIDDAVWAKWIAQSPTELATRPDILGAARANLQGRIYITVAEHDEFDLFDPARRFVDKLAAAGLTAMFAPTSGGHVEGVEPRERASVDFLLKALE